MHEVAVAVTALVSQVAHLLAFISPADMTPPTW
jgi:hypothetical protein